MVAKAESLVKPLRAVVIADCDFIDKPLGGVVSLLNNMLSVQGDGLVEFSLVGISFDSQEAEGVWQHKTVQRQTYRWMPVYVSPKAKDDTRFPLRFRLVLGVMRYLRVIGLEEFDVAYIHSAETVLALYSRDLPLVCHVHGDPLLTITRSRFPLLRSKVLVSKYNKIIHRAFDRATGIIWAANACRLEYYRRLGVDEVPRWDEKSTVVYSSVDPVMAGDEKDALLSLQCAKYQNKKHIVTVSRLSDVKHIDFLIQVFAMLKNSYPDIEFDIAGEGECESALKELALSLGCSDDVRFLGNLSKLQLTKLLKTMDVFVFASESEAMSLVVLESMAAGVPVVSTRVGDLDRVINERTGAVVEDRDVDTFSKAVIGVLEKGKDAYRHTCISTARQFSAVKMRRNIEEFLRQCAR